MKISENEKSITKSPQLTGEGSMTIETAIILVMLICCFLGAIYLSADAVAKIQNASEETVSEYEEDLKEADCAGWLRKMYALLGGLAD